MSEYTEHYNLKKPAQSENYNVEVANTNNTIIDNVLYNKVDKKIGKDLSTNDFTDNYKRKIDTLQNIYNFISSVQTKAELLLIEKQRNGDVYNVIEENKDYAWNGSEWVVLGSATNTDNLVTKEELNQQATQQSQKNAEQDGRLDNVEAKNAEQDTAIANKVDKTTQTASDLNDITDECTVYCTSTTANKPISINRMVQSD